MVALRHLFHQRTVIEDSKADGLDLALNTLEDLPGQLYTLRGSRMWYRNQSGEEIVRYIREVLPLYYHYSSSVTRKKDGKGTIHIRIKIEEWTGIRSEYRPPSPFDKTFVITTRI